MSTTREQLIADWRDRLAEANAAGSPRGAWLNRVRIRLYRFLLSLYGEGRWNASAHADAQPADHDKSAVIFDLPEALPLAGKPAKSDETISAALKSVAGAQGNRCPPGTYAPGAVPASGVFSLPENSRLRRALVATESWRIVASAEWNLDVAKCHKLLKANGLHPRLVNCAGHELIEVISDEQPKAVRLIRQNHLKLLLPPLGCRPLRNAATKLPPAWELYASLVIHFLGFTFLLSAGLVSLLVLVQLPVGKPLPLIELIFSAEFAVIWIAVSGATLLAGYLRMLR